MINIIYLLFHALDIARSRLLEGIILVRRRRRPTQSISRAKKELFELQLCRPKQPVRIFTIVAPRTRCARFATSLAIERSLACGAGLDPPSAC